jgi:hypothetical protein
MASRGEFPDCGCHYTNDDDGIHFCPMHKAAPDLLAVCKSLVWHYPDLDEIIGPEQGKAAKQIIADAIAAIAKAEGT